MLGSRLEKREAENKASSFGDWIVKNMEQGIGKRYGTGPGEVNCVTLPKKAIEKFLEEKGKKIDFARWFVNGGKTLSKVEENGEIFEIKNGQKLLNEAPKNGMLLMRLKKANLSEIDKFYNAGDYAIWKSADGTARTVKSRQEAKGLFEKMGKGEGELYFCRHYLTVINENNKTSVIHASSAKGKVVKETLQEYIKQFDSGSAWVLVDLEKLLIKEKDAREGFFKKT